MQVLFLKINKNNILSKYEFLSPGKMKQLHVLMLLIGTQMVYEALNTQCGCSGKKKRQLNSIQESDLWLKQSQHERVQMCRGQHVFQRLGEANPCVPRVQRAVSLFFQPVLPSLDMCHPPTLIFENNIQLLVSKTQLKGNKLPKSPTITVDGLGKAFLMASELKSRAKMQYLHHVTCLAILPLTAGDKFPVIWTENTDIN